MTIERPAELGDLDDCMHELAALGFSATTVVKPRGGVACGVCGHIASARDVEILAVRRLEGETDPSDERIVLGVRCKGCGHKGAFALTYGPAASTDDADVLLLLDTRVWRAHAW